MTDFVIWPGPDAVRETVGGKAASLAALGAAGLPPPAWCAVSPAAFHASVDPERAARAASGDLEALAELTPSDAVRDAVLAAAKRLSPDGAPLAVRSSGVDEDGLGHSFAGQFDSFLNVSVEALPDRLADVWRSGFSDRVRAYRAERDLPAPGPPAVILQRMAKADAAGVAFSVDPITGDPDIAVVSAVPGLADKLVHGEVTGDDFRVAADGAVRERRLAGDAACLTDDQARAVAALARTAESAFGAPQDVEWAIEQGRLVALQARPITTFALGGLSRILWDNSNIVESYPGVTTPLTFTFARGAYEAVYRQLARVLGVSQKRVDENAAVFANMIGFVDGRIYYNLVNWYRALALLPGFGLNRAFMEQMMGVDQELPAAIAREIAKRPAASAWSKIAGGFALAGAATGLIWARLRLKGRVRRFHAEVDAALEGGPDLSRAPYDALLAEYDRLSEALLKRWTPPLVNDLWCMIAFGVAKNRAAKWAEDADGGRLNAALVDQGGVVSAEPVKLITAMAALIADRPDLQAALAEADPETVAHALDTAPELQTALQAYLAKFGDRCAAELKLEVATLHEDPGSLYRAVAAAAAAPPRAAEAGNGEDALADLLAPVKNPFSRQVLRSAAKAAAARIRDRENMRFERTRVFGRVRRIFLAMGERLEAAGRLDAGRDVFFLTLDELRGAADGSYPAAELAGLARARREACDAQRRATAPPRRFESVGALRLAVYAPVLGGAPPEIEDVGAGARKGLGCCPGVVTGRARVVTDPAGVALAPGDILVAAFTDPGWVTLFAQASGLVVERGSMLSHSAIVAREIGLPAVIGLTDACAWIEDGEIIEIDGATGIVRKPEEAVAAAPEAAA